MGKLTVHHDSKMQPRKAQRAASALMQLCGLPLAYLGTLLLIVRVLLVRGSGNVLSVLSVLLILAGIILYVRRLKHSGEY